MICPYCTSREIKVYQKTIDAYVCINCARVCKKSDFENAELEKFVTDCEENPSSDNLRFLM